MLQRRELVYQNGFKVIHLTSPDGNFVQTSLSNEEPVKYPVCERDKLLSEVSKSFGVELDPATEKLYIEKPIKDAEKLQMIAGLNVNYYFTKVDSKSYQLIVYYNGQVICQHLAPRAMTTKEVDSVIEDVENELIRQSPEIQRCLNRVADMVAKVR